MKRVRVGVGIGGAALVFGGLLAACGGEVGTASDVRTISARDIEALPAGARLTLDITDPRVGYTFDYSAGPIDTARIDLVQPDGAEIGLEEVLEDQGGITNRGAGAAIEGRDPIDFIGQLDPQAPPKSDQPCSEWSWYVGGGLVLVENPCKGVKRKDGRAWDMGRIPPQGPPGPRLGSGTGGGGEPGTGPDTGDPNDGGRPPNEGSGGTGNGGSGDQSGGSSGTAGTPGGQGTAGGNQGGSSGTGGGRGFF